MVRSMLERSMLERSMLKARQVSGLEGCVCGKRQQRQMAAGMG